MAYAGTFKINTQFETRDANSQILRLTNEIKKTEAEISRLQAKMSSMKDAKIPTYEYQEMQKELQRAEENADKLYGKLRLLEKSGDTSSKGYRKLVNEINLADQQVNNLREGLSGLEAAGKAFIPGDMSLEFEKASQKVDELNGKLEVSKAKLNELLNKQGSTKGIFSRMQKAASGLLPVIKGIDQKFTSVFGRIRNAASKAFSSINKQGKKTGGIMSTLASRFKGIALSLLLFNWITKGFNAMISGAKAGLKNLEKYSNEYKQSIRDLQNALGTLRNSFAAAFAPIITAAVPYLIELINWVNRAVNALGQLFAYMTGHATWKKATEVQDAYKDALNGTAGAAKKAAGALAKFDDIDVLNKNTGGGGGGGSTGGFEEVPIDGAIKSFWDKIKKMWQDADFYDLGKLLAEKINDMLESIDWSKVRETARKLGKSLATFLNGILENLDWHLLGVSIAQGINTAFEFAYGFVKNFNWQKFGEAIAETINGFMDGLDWELIADTIITGAAGVATSVMGFVRTLNWEQLAQTLANGINVAVDGLIAFLDGIDWGELGRNIGKFIINSIKGIDWKDIGRALGKIVQNAFDFLAGILNEMNYETIKKAISDLFEGFGEETKDLPGWVTNLAEAFIALKLALFALDGVIAGSKLIIFLANAKILFNGSANEAAAASGAFAAAKDTLGIFAGALGPIMNTIANMGPTVLLLEEMKRIWENLFGPGEIKNAEDFADALNKLNDKYKDGKISLSEYNDGIAELVQKAEDAGIQVEEGLTEKLQAVNLYESGRNASKGFVQGFENGFDEGNEPMLSKFSTLVNDVKSKLGIHSPSTVFAEIGSFLIEGLLLGMQEMWVSLQEWFVTTFDNLILFFTEKWVLIKDGALEIWNELKDSLAETWESIRETVAEKFEAVREKIEEIWNSVKECVDLKVKNIKDKIKELTDNFTEFKASVSTTFTNIKESIINTLSPVIDKLKDFIQWVKDAIQAVKDFFSSGYDQVGTPAGKTSKTTNTRSFMAEIPTSISAAMADIPHLASGSVIRGGNPFLALLGDQPRGQMNVEAPAGLIKDMVKAGIAESGIGKERLPVTINMIYDGETFARLSISDILSEMDRQGLDIDVLGWR
ncbi:hypothetical protein [Eisenbergiella tayi]|uniref:hypothetical protein n=1 Tax=Eisenbergiella tayi TaxID=1432052 RepID=UPI00307B54AF